MNNYSQKIQDNKIAWHQNLKNALSEGQIDYNIQLEGNFCLINLDKNCLLINLVSIHNSFTADELLKLQNHFHLQNIKLIHLWEDVWLTKPQQVLARIRSLTGLNLRIHGRKTKVFKITKPVSDAFLNINHLQGAVSSRYKLGLFLNDDLVAVATFSALRQMKHTANYKSAELIRFAVKSGYSVTGGLSKLINHFYELLKPNDIMTYADRDWSAGEAYSTLGFVQTDVLASKSFILDDSLNRHLEKVQTFSSKRKEVFNTGSLKYLLKF
ncbi:hypothetical protein [Pedobacter punctiformis]|uniref:GNAT family N-acetyltransferase n=1 Tax=Pedobacter punctiformis TaxID=3004097 RepID=A0ABT4L6U5_9SPHI|nr:hypothetical protein [Pedobacter sp. HCMS5-2]MCZ4243635.1 hypothetical protein [Pedobacter sp. HCMS5-2]